MRSTTVVVGIDIGFSEQRRSTAVAAIDLSADRTVLGVRRCTAARSDISAALADVLGPEARAAACAIDGPLRPGLALSSRRRLCERLLVLGKMGKRCRPGEVLTPQGFRLHQAATAAATLVAPRVLPPPACVPEKVLPVPPAALCEAFPSAFMAFLVPEGSFDHLALVPRGRKTDWLYEEMLAGRSFAAMLADLLGARSTRHLMRQMAAVTNHDERAAVVCAVTALCLIRCRFAAVGDDKGGYIILPPRERWAPWVADALDASIAALRTRGIRASAPLLLPDRP